MIMHEVTLVHSLVLKMPENMFGICCWISSLYLRYFSCLKWNIECENVLFRNIEELQEQNQRLLTVVRELSEEKELDEQKEKSNLA